MRGIMKGIMKATPEMVRRALENLANELAIQRVFTMEVGDCDICGTEWRSGRIIGAKWVCWKCEEGDL